MAKHKDIRQSIQENSMKTCSVPGCLKSRHGLSKYCCSHQHQHANFGHPLASKITFKDFEAEQQQASNVIDLNESHEGIQYGLEFLDKLLLQCAQGTSHFKYADNLATLRDQGVSGREILTTLAALYVLRDGQSRRIKSDRHLTYLLGHFVLKLAKQASRVYGSQRKAIGEFLQEHIAPILLNISKSVQAVALERDKALLDMCKPLVLE